MTLRPTVMGILEFFVYRTRMFMWSFGRHLCKDYIGVLAKGLLDHGSCASSSTYLG